MGKKQIMLPANEVDLTAVKYVPEKIEAPHLTGLWFKLFVKVMEAPVIGSLIASHLKEKNGITEILKNTVIPEVPMFIPQFPLQEPEPGVVCLEEDGKPEERVALALKCLPHYDPTCRWSSDSGEPFQFRYWKIRDYGYAYRSKLTTPSMASDFSFFVLFRSSSRLINLCHAKGCRTLYLSNGVKDDIDCYPHPSKGGSKWFHEVRQVKADGVSVSRLRNSGAILVGKTNMHEFGMGTTGNNPNYGTPGNPHNPKRYTGGSSSGSAAIVASGLCSAALGTDGGGSVRIPASLCGVVGLKTTFGRTDLTGSLWEAGTVTIIGPITATVEDAILVYAAISGSSPADRIRLNPSIPCLPDLSSSEGSNILGSLTLGKYTKWFNDVSSTDISDKCEDVLNQLFRLYGCKTTEIVIPELRELRTAHTVTFGSESLCLLNPDCEAGKGVRLTNDTRTNLALFRSFAASDYISAQCLRRRIMYYHMEIFKKVDVIVTPTTGMTAPEIPESALAVGETNLQVVASLMQFAMTANVLGLPAISVPIGHDKQGLPIGLQLIGRPWCEASILRLAAAIEEISAEYRKKPVEFYDIFKGKSNFNSFHD
uniref:Glutamyl-tRNA(Gln) amidotransferase subunit A n=1 Tax=Solanum tuberosum TaxID=4113 RepID=M0ZU18_SOLTU